MDRDALQRSDSMLVATIALLVSFGLVMVYSASFPEAYTRYDSGTFFLKRQLIWALLGVVGVLVVVRLPYYKLRRLSVPFMGLTLVLLLLVLILPEEMTTENGAARWIRIGEVGIQPSEVAKLAAIIYFADWLSKRGSKIRNLAMLANFAVVLGFIAGLILLEPDMGTTIVFVLIGATVLFASGANILHLAVASALAVGAGWLAILSASYRMDRLTAYRDPWAFADTIGYQPIHSLYGLASGGIFGAGLGEGRQKFLWLPTSHTDAIMSVIGEEFGLVGTVLVVLAFIFFAFRGYRVAARIEDSFGALLAVGITSWIVLQALLNIAVVSTLVPFTGVTLPFISYGGSSLIMTMLAAGVLLNLSRYAAPRTFEAIDHEQEHLSFREWLVGLAYAPAALWRRDRRSRVSGAGSRRRFARRRSRSRSQPSASSFAVGQPLSGSWREYAAKERRQRSGSRSVPLRPDGQALDLRGKHQGHGGADRQE